MFTCGFVRSNFAFAMAIALSSRRSGGSSSIHVLGHRRPDPTPAGRTDLRINSVRDRQPGDGLERVKGIEPSSSAWKAAALPLSYTRAAAGGGGWIRTNVGVANGFTVRPL